MAESNPKFVVIANGHDGWFPVCSMLAPDGKETEDPELAVIAIIQLRDGMYTGAAVEPDNLIPWADRDKPQ